MKKIYGILLITIIFSLFGQSNIYAQNEILPPQNLSASVGADNNGAFVDLQWLPANSGMQPVGYSIFIAYGQTQDINLFKNYAQVTYNAYTQQYNKKIYLQNGKYSFFVKAFAYANNRKFESAATTIINAEITGGNPDRKYIKITSQPVDFVQPGQDYSYQVKAETNLPAECPLVYKLITAPQGMAIDESTGMIKWVTTANGYYSVALQVGTNCKIDVNTAYQKFILRVGENNNRIYVKFTSTPPPVGYVGKPYTYQVQTSTNGNCSVRYSLIVKQTDLIKFDEKTGLLQILTDKPITVGGMIKAYLECDTNVVAFQQFYIRFTGDQTDNLCAKITGKVHFEDNIIVTDGVARAFRLTDRNDKYPVYVAKIQQGFFSIPVPEGTYIVDFDGLGIQQEWYENAAEMDNASKLELKCGDNRELNVVLAKKPEPKRYSVSGKVISEEDGKPVLAYVEFIPLEKNNYYNQGFSAKTDTDGNYKLDLPENMTFRAHAVPIDRMHLDQWYDKVQSPLEADLIVPESDMQGIDFILKKYTQQTKYGFSGKVVNINNESVKSMLQVIPVGLQNNYMKNNIAVTYTDDNGNYRFNNLALGKYVVLSIPADRKYVPGYYKAGDIATLKWREATIINVAEVTVDMIFEIKHRERAGFKGIINLNGNVIASGITLKSSDKPLGITIPLAGAFVYVLDEFGQVSDFAFTDINGHYELSEISEGSSSMFVDMVGFNEYRKDYTGDYTMSYNSSINIELTPETATVVEEASSLNLMLYPQPANDHVLINLSGFNNNLQLFIFNSTGNLVGTYSPQTELFRLELNNFPSGIYSIVANDGQNIKRGIVTIIK